MTATFHNTGSEPESRVSFAPYISGGEDGCGVVQIWERIEEFVDNKAVRMFTVDSTCPVGEYEVGVAFNFSEH